MQSPMRFGEPGRPGSGTQRRGLTCDPCLHAKHRACKGQCPCNICARRSEPGQPRPARVKSTGGWRLDPKVEAIILKLTEEGMGQKAIAAKLNADGVPTARGGKEWRQGNIHVVLKRLKP